MLLVLLYFVFLLLLVVFVVSNPQRKKTTKLKEKFSKTLAYSNFKNYCILFYRVKLHLCLLELNNRPLNIIAHRSAFYFIFDPPPIFLWPLKLNFLPAPAPIAARTEPFYVKWGGCSSYIFGWRMLIKYAHKKCNCHAMIRNKKPFLKTCCLIKIVELFLIWH